MPCKSRDVERSLKAKGFEKQEGDHHYFFYRTKAGKLTSIRTKFSHSATEIPDGLIGAMARQCHLTKPQFIEFVDCSLGQHAYEVILTHGKHIGS